MKKFNQLLIVSLVALTLTSCAKQEVNNGLYIFSVILLGLSVKKFLNVRKAWKQGESTQQTPSGITLDKIKKLPVGELVYGIAFLLAAIAISLMIYSENRNYDPKRDDPYPATPAPDGREAAEDQAAKADSVYNMKK